MSAELVPFGIIGRTHGLKGALWAKFLTGVELSDRFDIEEPVYLEIEGDPVPFFLDLLQIDGDRFRFKFESVNSIDEAQSFVGKELLINSEFLLYDESESLFKDYDLIDQNEQNIGKVLALRETGLNRLLELERDQGEPALIPFDESLLIDLNHDEKWIQMEIAEGLLDL